MDLHGGSGHYDIIGMTHLSPTLAATLRSLGLQPPSCRSILLVDDEQENLDVLEATLEDEWDVRTANNGAAALDVWNASGGVNLVISDQRMPKMTGIELLAEIARREPETIRIILTGYSDVEPIVAAINQGAVYRFLLKPWDPNEMRVSVRDALGLYTSRIALHQIAGALDERARVLRETLEELGRTTDQMMAAERVGTLGRMTAGITHDIGNHLNAMMLLVDTVQQDSNDPELLSCARNALATLESMFYLVRDVNAFTRGQTLDIQPSSEKPRVFLQETVSFIEMEDPGARGRITLDLDGAPDQILVDSNHMRQAILALLRNALRASAGGAPVVLGLDSAPDHSLRIWITDKGSGMDPQTLARAKEPFFSGFEPTGLGLGLEIARLVAEAHRGVLEIESSPVEGTKATLTMEGRLGSTASGTQ